VIAVDWSGRKVGAEDSIAIAECSADGLRLVGKGRDREATIGYLIDRAAGDPGLVVGLDFAFSAPAWFVDAVGASDGPGFWQIVEERGEDWLAGEPVFADGVLPGGTSPFFGRAGSRRPSGVALHRGTEGGLGAADPTATPKSFFQIGGPGAVGTMSIRGMPWLRRLAEAGFRIWPFHEPEPGRPTVVEIYPRALTGITGKGSPEACRRVLAEFGDLIDPGLVEQIAADDDLFDAAVSAAVMWRRRGDFERLGAGDRREGKIWLPGPA
jgi:hypothetical protein